MLVDALDIMKQKSGKTLQQISDECGIPKGTLNKIFAGQTKDPQYGTLKNIVHALGFTVDDLNAQIADLQSQLDSKTAEYNELSNEKSSVEDLTQQAYEEGWNDACYEYDLEPNSDDIPAYDYVAEIDKDNSPTAYITPSGKRYHLSQSCAGENAIKTTIAEASDNGYTPCMNCAQ